MTAMRKTLQRDIYNLRYPGFPINKVEQPDPDPLNFIRYSCTYWINHLIDGNPQKEEDHIQDYDNVYEFLKEHLLHWMEVMSLIGKFSEGINAISSLEYYISVSTCFVLV